MKHKISVTEESRNILTGLGWQTYPAPVQPLSDITHGYFFKNIPADLRELWIGAIKITNPQLEIKKAEMGNRKVWVPKLDGIFLTLHPCGEKVTGKILAEGFKWFDLVPGWFYKRIISTTNIG